MVRLLIIFLPVFLPAIAWGQTREMRCPRMVDSGQHTSIRAISVVSERVVWVSGSGGMVGLSIDGGFHWAWHRVKKGLDLRSLKGFSEKIAVVINAGSPAFILRTEDGAKTWKRVYANHNPAVFFDAMVFADSRRGLAVSDPVGGYFLMLLTRDGGKTWHSLAHPPQADSGEACFAASNSSLVFQASGSIWLGTGGLESRILHSNDGGKSWSGERDTMIQGSPSTGIFSIAFLDPSHGMAVGGDYSADSIRVNNALVTKDGGLSWSRPLVNPFGFRSAVVWLDARTLVATGTSGTDISEDGGSTWKRLCGDGYNVVQPSLDHRKIWLAGSDGRIARWTVRGS